MKNKTVYCHFSFRRPKDKEYGIFAVALYKDYVGKQFVTKSVTVQKLWQNHQHVTAIQAYANALNVLYKWQASLLQYNVTNVMLVTDNSNLALWIQKPKKSVKFREWMDKAYEPFQSGNKQFRLGIGLCAVREYEKSYKFCNEQNVENFSEYMNKNKPTHKTVIESEGFISLEDILNEDKPEISEGFKPISGTV